MKRLLSAKRVQFSLVVFILMAAASVALSSVSSGDGSSQLPPPQRNPVALDIDAISIAPSDDANAVVSGAAPGSSFLFLDGRHRGVSILARDGDEFRARRGAVLAGSVELGEFVADGANWVVDAPGLPTEPYGECQFDRPLCGHPEELFVDGEPIPRVLTRDEVSTGSWYFDADGPTVVMGDEPAGRTIELGWLPFAINSDALGVVIDGLTIEQYATPSGQGTINMSNGAASWDISGCTVRLNHGTGIVIGDDSSVRGCVVERNGQQGIGGSGADLLIEKNRILGNNRLGFDSGWSAGGVKLAFVERAVMSENVVQDNDGPGLWTDLDGRDVVYVDNEVENNSGPGIIHEISYAAEVRDNYVAGNGFGAPKGWVWGAGIQIANSSDVTVTGNHVERNQHGIVGTDQNRGAGEQGSWELRALIVTGNTVVDSGQTGIAQDHGVVDVYRRDHRFENNQYVGSVSFGWNDAAIDFEEWQAAGNDTDGSLTAS